MGLKPLRLATISLGYILILLCTSVLTVFLVTPFHTPFLGSEQYSPVDAAITDYFLHGNEKKLQQETGLTESEVMHMSDVREILVKTALIGVTGGILLTLSRPKKNTEKTVMLASPLYLNGVIMTGVLISSIIGFSKVFEAFHKMFFPQGNYAFSYSSLLIRTYPESFFAVQGIMIILTLTTLNILIAIGEYMKRKREKKK
ncbi:MAG: DUF1461 domain-containing protein [Candidatus Woesearchaeota archaeon]